MLEAEHMCMSLRGVEKPGSSTITTQFAGSFRDNPEEQMRFITLVRGALICAAAPPGFRASIGACLG